VRTIYVIRDGQLVEKTTAEPEVFQLLIEPGDAGRYADFAAWMDRTIRARFGGEQSPNG
jgi:hypothetical protein